MEVLNLEKSLNLNHGITSKKSKFDSRSLQIRLASPMDAEVVYDIAASVGSKKKNPEEGFLMDNYVSSPNKYKKFFLERINELKYFYIAKFKKDTLGFLMAYTKEEWLKYNPNWIESTYWAPNFDMNKTDNFVVIDKTAILAGNTGKGIGSMLYKRLISDLKFAGIEIIFAETLISPIPNLASLAFRKKQKYTFAGVRYENFENNIYTDLIYYKSAK